MLGLLGIAFVCGLALPTFAADLTGTIASFSGDLVSYFQTQKDTINTLFDSWYATIYQELSKTWLSMLQTTDYQSLVCLWVLPAESILSQLQKDKASLKTSLNRNFSDLADKIVSIEEKNNLQKQTHVDLFDGSTYEIQKWLLKTEIDTTVATDRTLIQSFTSGYKAKVRSFLVDYIQYGAQNKELVKVLGARIAKITYVTSWFSAVQDKVSTMYQAMGISDVMDKFEILKTKALSALSAQLDPIIAIKMRVYKILPALSGDLLVQKQATINQYRLDMDEYFASAFQKWYDRGAYTKLVESFAKFKTTYYTNQRLNCSTIIGGSNDDTGLALLTIQIGKVSANISSGIAAAQSSTGKEAFKAGLLTGFRNIFNVPILKQRVASFQNGIKSIITNIQNLLTPTTVTTGSTTTGSTDTIVIPLGFIFTKPFTLGQKSSDVGILQQVLKSLELYAGPIDNTFTQATKDALYSYQLQKKILTTKSSPSLRWLLGPATRKALNLLLSK